MGFQVVFSLILLVREGAWGGIVDIYGKVTHSENWVLLEKKKKSNSLDTLEQMHFCQNAGEAGEKNFTLRKNGGGRRKEVSKMSFKWQWISCISWSVGILLHLHI